MIFSGDAGKCTRPSADKSERRWPNDGKTLMPASLRQTSPWRIGLREIRSGEKDRSDPRAAPRTPARGFFLVVGAPALGPSSRYATQVVYSRGPRLRSGPIGCSPTDWTRTMSGTNQQDTLRITVSELAAFADCPRCVQRRWRDNENPADADHPGKRRRTRQAANSAWQGKRADEICSHLPPGRFAERARRLRTAPIWVQGHPVPMVITGELPVPLVLDAGGYGIVRSTTDSRDQGSCRYIKRQLEAYAMLSEQHHDAAQAPCPVQELWIVWCIWSAGNTLPSACEHLTRDHEWFIGDLERIAELIRSPMTYAPSSSCTRCR